MKKSEKQVAIRLAYLRRLQRHFDQNADEPFEMPPDGVEGLRSWAMPSENIFPIGRRNDFTRNHRSVGKAVEEMLAIAKALRTTPATQGAAGKKKRPTLAEQLEQARADLSQRDDQLVQLSNQYQEDSYERDFLRSNVKNGREGQRVLSEDYRDALEEIGRLQARVLELEAEQSQKPRAPHLRLVEE